MLHIIIDGYNLIRQTPELLGYEAKSLELARKKLVVLLADYKKIKGHKLTVVFDGNSTLAESATAYKQAGITVMYSSAYQKADDVIVTLAKAERERALIVSSDLGIVRPAQSFGASTMSANAFFNRLVHFGPTQKSRDENPSKRLSTKKKGNGKKISKRERQGVLKRQKI